MYRTLALEVSLTLVEATTRWVGALCDGWLDGWMDAGEPGAPRNGGRAANLVGILLLLFRRRRARGVGDERNDESRNLSETRLRVINLFF